MAGENIEQEARSMGWVPQADFRGDPARWVDADTFVERGHTVMPILRKNNERLEGTVKAQQAELARMKGMIEAGQEAIAALQEVHTSATKAAVEKAKADLLKELKDAKRDGDVDREVEITEALADIRVKQADAGPVQKQAPQSSQTGAATDHPDFAPWKSDNPWFGSDQRKTMRAMGIAQELRSDPAFDSLEGRAFFDKVVEVMDQRSGASTVSTTKVAGGAGPSTPSSGGDKGYAGLPADAKEACDRQGQRLVGPGRAFKDESAWRSYYAKLYYNQGN